MTATSSSAPWQSITPHRETTPTPGSPRASRSSKRVKQTPTPSHTSPNVSSTSGAGPSRFRSGESAPRRPALGDRRGVTFDAHAATSPYRSAGISSESWGLSGRRREMSVPSLSQTLSHFSLSRLSPPMAVMAAMASPDHVPEHRPPPPTKSLRQQTPIKLAMSKTPRRDNLTMTRTPYATGLPKDHVYPPTAPLPHLPTFLGSPFSTKTPRGKYVYDTTSPSKGVMTERGGQNVFEQMGLDWLGRSEWMADEANDVEERFETEIEPEHQPTVLPRRSSRSRREASGSTSSLDDFSGSGTSSASLLSLGRTSGEYHVRPNIVTIWRGEEDDLDHEDVDPATPSRQSLAVTNDTDGTLPMSAKTARQSPGLSPQSGKKTSLKSPAGQVSPLQQFHLSLSPSDCAAALYQPPPSAAKATRSPLSNFLPRLLSSAKEDNDSAKGTKTSRPPRLSAQAVRELEVVMTDTEDNGSETSHSNGRPLRGSPLHRGYIEGTENADLASSFGSGIGLGIQQSVEPAAMLPLRSLGRTTPFSRSASSESSSEIDPSPSKFLSARASAAQLSPSLSTAFTPPIILTRRKTMAFPAKVSTKSSPAASFARPRPVRPLVRRGINESRAVTDHTIGTPTNGLLTVHTPFADIKPSPAAFASTGLVRKKSGVAGIDLPKFGQATEPLRPLKSLSPIKLPSLISAKDVSNPLRAAQKTRGLRRKGSTMFTIGPSGSIGDVVKTDCTFSPATPTKPTFRVVPIGLGVTTPSPTSGMGMIYPFASSTSLKALHTPPSSDLARSSDGPISSPLDKLMALPGRLRDLTGAGGPIARASNPMLAASYKAHRSSAPPGPTGAAKRIAGRLERDFVLLQSLGSGEFSQVWKVRDKKHGRLWAVKAGKPYTGYTNRYPKLHGLDCLLTWGSLRQLEEVSILRNLSVEPHPHVIDFIDSWEHNDRLFIRTELAECGDLSRFLLSLGDYAGMGEAQVWKTLVELSSGLRHIHGQNVLHLDIKPSNILITYAGSLKIADFGVSTILGPEGYAADLSPALPSTGQDGGFVWTDRQAVGLVRSPILDREVEGDREYLSPEALGDAQVGREADVFSLGILLLEAALNVVLPSNGDGWIKLRNNDFSALTEHYQPRGQTGDDGLPQISGVLMSTIRGMMASCPAERMTLDEMTMVRPVRRIRETEGVSAALVEEGVDFLEKVLGE